MGFGKVIVNRTKPSPLLDVLFISSIPPTPTRSVHNTW
uniref:Uncharacterized protein n=1 Tax=Anopheles minimus TaxID=112268 RepID=A0A182WQG2_9DIPT